MYINEKDLTLEDCINKNLEYSCGKYNDKYVDFVIVSLKELDAVIDITKNITKQMRSYIKKQFENFDFCKMKNTAFVVSYFCQNEELNDIYFQELILLYYYKHYQKIKKEFSYVSLLHPTSENTTSLENAETVTEEDLEPDEYELYEKQRLEHLENHMKKIYPKYSIGMAEYLADSCILEQEDEIDYYLGTRKIPLYAKYILKEICDIRFYDLGISKNSLIRFDKKNKVITQTYFEKHFEKPDLFKSYLFNATASQVNLGVTNSTNFLPFAFFVNQNIGTSLAFDFNTELLELKQKIFDFLLHHYISNTQYIDNQKQMQFEEWVKLILQRLSEYWPIFLFTTTANQLSQSNIIEIKVNPCENFTFLRFGLIKNPFQYCEDGVYEINLYDYILFLQYIGIDTEYIFTPPKRLLLGVNNKENKLFLLKYNQNYGFFIKTKKGISIVYKRIYKLISKAKDITSIIEDFKMRMEDTRRKKYNNDCHLCLEWTRPCRWDKSIEVKSCYCNVCTCHCNRCIY